MAECLTMTGDVLPILLIVGLSCLAAGVALAAALGE